MPFSRQWRYHEKSRVGCLLAFLFSRGTGFAQTKEPSDPYKPILDRLESLETLPFPEWRYHADMPHPEDATLSDSDWPTVKIREGWKTGSRVKLELFLTSKDSMTITVCSNGSLVERGDEDTQQAILLTENAQPGQKFVIAVRADAGGRQTPIYGRRLHLEAPTNRPNPNILGEEILSAQPMVVSVSHLTHQIEIAGGSGHSATILVLVATRRPALPAAGRPSPYASSGSNTLIPPGGNDVPLQFHLKIERDDCNSLDYDNECGGGFRGA